VNRGNPKSPSKEDDGPEFLDFRRHSQRTQDIPNLVAGLETPDLFRGSSNLLNDQGN
jgi:hypothetical protein